MSPILDQIQRGIDHIEAHLEGTLALPDVSSAAGMSHWHFQRTFRAITGETLMSYVRSRRLSRASVRLLDSDDRLIDIALDAGFESQESFTRAFRRVYGVPPGQLRRLGQRRLFPQKLRIDTSYLAHLDGGVVREPQIEERNAQPVFGLHTPCFGVDSDKNDVADRIPPLWERFLPALAELEGPPRTHCYGLIRSEPGEEALSYLACTDQGGVEPDAFVADVVPAGTWAVFEHRGPTAGLDHTVSYVYATWLATSRHWRHTHGPDLEIYGPQWHPTSDGSVMHYAIPVRPA